MQFIKSNINIDFIGKTNITLVLSTFMILVSISSIIFHKGLNYGIDFTGGTLIQLKFENPINIDQIRSKLVLNNFESSSIQSFGNKENNEFLIRTNESITNADFSEKTEKAFNSIEATTNIAKIRRLEVVGPQVGKELREKALLAMFYALLITAVYISGRFELKWGLSGSIAFSLMAIVYFLSLFEVPVYVLIIIALLICLLTFWFMKLKYAMGAILALIHDVTIIVGVFSILDKEFSLSTVAALLTTVGYSLNDSIIVFDRIRENLHKNSSKQFSVLINKSINETLGRTILTSLTTLAVVLTLLILGGGIIHDFALALAIGVMVGTYSSIYVASPILLAWQKQKS